MKQGKTWGTTQEIFRDDHVEVHRIFVKRGGFCSNHRHKCKSNLFFVESGRLRIAAKKIDYNLVDETLVGPGETTTIPPGEYHRFEALDDTIAFEIYFVTLEKNDIEREDHGGVRGQNN